MSDQPVPAEATQAAAVVFHDAHCGCLTDGHLRSYMDLARRALAAAAPWQCAEAVLARRAEQDAMHADLSELLDLLGFGNYARPQSPHEVFQMCLAKLRDLPPPAEATEADTP